MKKDLYKWQKDCLRKWEENHRRGIAHVVTGAGKTILAIAAIESVRGLFPDLMVRIVVPTIPLARQWETALRHHMGAEEWRPGLYGAGRRDDPERHVMIYIINSSLSKQREQKDFRIQKGSGKRSLFCTGAFGYAAGNCQ